VLYLSQNGDILSDAGLAPAEVADLTTQLPSL
jgi:hypothetical protein